MVATGPACESAEPSPRYQVRQATRALPAALCARDSYFRECFRVEYDLCMEWMRELAADCRPTPEQAVPAVIDGEVFTWQQMMVHCMRVGFEIRGLTVNRYRQGCTDRDHGYRHQPPPKRPDRGP